MKALEYLKREREIKKHCADVAWGYYDKSIDEAIEELEELKNRSCENCKYWKTSQLDGNSICKKLFNFRSYFDFCCNKWEPK